MLVSVRVSPVSFGALGCPVDVWYGRTGPRTSFRRVSVTIKDEGDGTVERTETGR